MEFHEKLRELRKSKGLTQEELAEALYVSRTAISKWESGRGYPNIDSLKEIASYFSVTIDELLTGEKLLCIAEKENKSNIQEICDFVFGMIDIVSFILIVLPLYPNEVEGYIYSVNLLTYTTETGGIHFIYWVMFTTLILAGIVKVVLIKANIQKNRKIVTNFSVVLNILIVIVLALTRQAYAIILAFLLLIAKGSLLLKNKEN